MIRFRAFGAADLRENDGNELRSVLSRPGQLALLAYLALARPRGFHRRDTIVGMFWPETGQDQARNALRQAVHRLRHELGPDVVVGRGADELGINPRALSSDVVEFEDALAAGQIVEALEHYRGDLLPGFFVSDAPEFDQWLERERARLRERAAVAVRDLSRQEAKRGELSAAAHWAWRAYSLRPDDEADLRHLLELLVRSGDHAGALRTYDEFAERFAREYEIEPSDATRALVTQLHAAHRAEPGVRRAAHRQELPSAMPTLAEVADRAPPSKFAAASSRHRRGRFAALGAGVAALAFGVVMIGWRYTRTTSEPSTEAIAVFPFSVRGRPDLNYLREGMVDLLSAKLDGVARMRSIDPRAVIAATRASDSSLNARPAAVAQISRQLGAGAFVIGDVVEIAGRVNLSGVLYDTRESARPVANISVEGDAADLAQLVDQLAGRLLAARTKVRDPGIAQLAALTTQSLPALTVYLQGESEFRAGHAEAARDAFRTAIREDSTFALAYIRLATTQGWSVVTRIDPLALLATARRFSTRLSPLARQLLEGYDAYYHFDGPGALEIFGNLTRMYPDRVEAWFMLGETQSHLAPFAGHSTSEARPAFERVLSLDPDNPQALVHLARLAAAEKRHDELQALVARYLATQPGGDRIAEMRSLSAFSRHDSAATATLLATSKNVGTLELYSMYLAATTYTENMEAANAVVDLVVDRQQRIEPSFAVFLSLIPVPKLMQGHLTRGGAVPGMEALNGGWPAVLRSELVVAAAVAMPVANLQALRDTIAAWHPSIGTAGFFPFPAKVLPQVRSYLLGVLSARLHDPAGVNSSITSLRLSAASNDSGVSLDLIHLVRAEDARNGHRLSEALREVERIQPPLRNYAAFSFRPAYAHARFLRAEILRELGRDDEAARWYGSLSEQYDAMYLPLMHLRMAQISQRRGLPGAAASHYARFVALWKDCDPELRPLVDQANAALQTRAN
jgi:serine/threonine-protein kinase